LGDFGRPVSDARRHSREGGNPVLSPWKGLVGGIMLGGEEFVARCRALIERHKPFRDIPRTERYADRPTLKDLFGTVPHRERDKRNACVARAYLEHGYTMKQIGDFLGLHYSTVSIIIDQAER
jgi:hypothetical protein